MSWQVFNMLEPIISDVVIGNIYNQRNRITSKKERVTALLFSALHRFNLQMRANYYMFSASLDLQLAVQTNLGRKKLLAMDYSL